MNYDYIVDRIINGLAVCEDPKGNMINIKLENIKGIVKEGVVLNKIGDNSFTVNEKKTSERRTYIDDFMKGMWEDE